MIRPGTYRQPTTPPCHNPHPHTEGGPAPRGAGQSPSTNASARAQRRGSGDARGCPSRDRDSAGIRWFPGAARRSGSVACSGHCHSSRVFHKCRVRLPGTIRMARWRVAPLPARAATTPYCCSTPAPVGVRQEHRHQPPEPPSPRSVATGTAPPAGAASRGCASTACSRPPPAHTPSSPVAANRTEHQDRAPTGSPRNPAAAKPPSATRGHNPHRSGNTPSKASQPPSSGPPAQTTPDQAPRAPARSRRRVESIFHSLNHQPARPTRAPADYTQKPWNQSSRGCRASF